MLIHRVNASYACRVIDVACCNNKVRSSFDTSTSALLESACSHRLDRNDRRAQSSSRRMRSKDSFQKRRRAKGIVDPGSRLLCLVATHMVLGRLPPMFSAIQKNRSKDRRGRRLFSCAWCTTPSQVAMRHEKQVVKSTQGARDSS